MTFWQDVQSAVRFTRQLRRARRAGATGVAARSVWSVPAVRPGLWGFTLEGCALAGYPDAAVRRAVMAVFAALPVETQRALTFAPDTPGAWTARARLWQGLLPGALPARECHCVLGLLAHRYAHALRMRGAAQVRLGKERNA